MSETQCLRIPLVAEHREDFLSFLRGIGGRRAELEAVLREEGMTAEIVLVDPCPDDPAIILLTRGESLEAAHQAYLASKHPIQIEMRRLSALAFDLERARPLEVALEYRAPDDAP